MSTHEHDPIGRLLADTPARPRPDPAERAAAYQAIKAEWHQAIAPPRSRTWMGMALAASVVLAVAAALWVAPTAPSGPSFDVARVEGEVLYWQGDDWQPLPHSGPLSIERIRTGAGSGLALIGEGGTQLRIDEASELIFSEAEVALESGAVFLVFGSASQAGYAVTSGSTRIEHIGTRFEVRGQPNSVDVRVRDGRIAVSGPGQRLELGAGEAVAVTGDGFGSVRQVAAHDPAWGWTQALAPAFDLDGRSVAEFLDWVGQETGWQVNYSDPATERAARRTTLAGSLDRVSAREALEPVLSSTRFRHRLEHDQILVLQD